MSTLEEKTEYNWVHRMASEPDSLWPNDTTEMLNMKLYRATHESVTKWTAGDLVERCL